MLNKLYEKITKFIKENYKSLLAIIFIIFLFNFELPYVIECPGGYINLKKRIEVENGLSSSGSFGMAYVTMMKANIPFTLITFLNPNWDLVKKSDLTYSDETMQELNKKEKLYLQESIDNAIINAYKNANKEYKIIDESLYITYLSSPDTELKEFDIIKEIDGQKITSLTELKEIINTKEVGDYLNVLVLRDNNYLTVKTIVYELNGAKKIGVNVTIDYELETNPNTTVKVKSSESGPSGGLMMSLEIYNALTPNDITKNYKIIGTGTIDNDGNVGEIGGVKYKLIGAVKKKADVFLCPKENLNEALEVAQKNNYNIKIIGVSSFLEALEELNNL